MKQLISVLLVLFSCAHAMDQKNQKIEQFYQQFAEYTKSINECDVGKEKLHKAIKRLDIALDYGRRTSIFDPSLIAERQLCCDVINALDYIRHQLENERKLLLDNDDFPAVDDYLNNYMHPRCANLVK